LASVGSPIPSPTRTDASPGGAPLVSRTPECSMGLLSPGCMVPTGVFSCLEFDVMREVNYSSLMMPQTGPALRGAFCLAASARFRGLT
jgi:hypothetical protein